MTLFLNLKTLTIFQYLVHIYTCIKKRKHSKLSVRNNSNYISQYHIFIDTFLLIFIILILNFTGNQRYLSFLFFYFHLSTSIRIVLRVLTTCTIKNLCPQTYSVQKTLLIPLRKPLPYSSY